MSVINGDKDEVVHSQSTGLANVAQTINSSGTQGFEPTESVPQLISEFTFAEPFINQKIIELVRYGVNIGSSVRIHDYYWKCQSQRHLIRTRKVCDIGWWLGTGVLIGYILFLIVQLTARIIIYDNGPDFDTLILSFGIVLLLLPLACETVSTLHPEVLVDFVNHAVEFCSNYVQSFDMNLRKTQTAELKIAIIFLRWAYAGLRISGCLLVCASIARPDLCAFFSALCSDWCSFCYIPMRVFSVFTIISAIFVCTAHCTIYLAGLALIICMLPTISYLNILHAKRDLFGPQELLHLYRQLFIIFEELNQLISNLLLPSLENILVTLTVFGFYGTVRVNGFLRPVLIGIGSVALSSLIISFWALGKVHTASSRVLATWQYDVRFSRRELRSIRAIRIRLASYAYVDAGIVLTLIDIIVNYSITLFITT